MRRSDNNEGFGGEMKTKKKDVKKLVVMCIMYQYFTVHEYMLVGVCSVSCQCTCMFSNSGCRVDVLFESFSKYWNWSSFSRCFYLYPVTTHSFLCDDEFFFIPTDNNLPKSEIGVVCRWLMGCHWNEKFFGKKKKKNCTSRLIEQLHEWVSWIFFFFFLFRFIYSKQILLQGSMTRIALL